MCERTAESMTINDLIDYYEGEIRHLKEDEKRFPQDDLGIEETLIIYQQFIHDLKQLV